MGKRVLSCWEPDAATVANANLTALIDDVGCADLAELRAWSLADRAAFWQALTTRLEVVFRQPAHEVLVGSGKDVRWFPGAKLNIAESCFGGDADSLAVASKEYAGWRRMSYGELNRASARFAGGLIKLGLSVGDRVGIVMPMTVDAVIAFLGVIRAGLVAAPVPDSFSSDEIRVRLSVAEVKTVVTQDVLHRQGKAHALLEKVVAAYGGPLVVAAGEPEAERASRDGMTSFDDVLAAPPLSQFVAREPSAELCVLFSSGTTSEPKAIVWDHLTPIKAAGDAHLYQDVHSADVVAWPTSLGWMMGPWLVFGTLMHGATMALCTDPPTTQAFATFVDEVKATLVGVVPSIVARWRANGALEDATFTTVRRFSSTGEASNEQDVRWLTSIKGRKPVIEYCGGTEIGGGFLAGTMITDCVPCEFATVALGSEIAILSVAGEPATEGELFIVPPTLGMSSRLLNADHDAIYYEGAPIREGSPLRRHGDAFRVTERGTFVAQGRTDDTMNLAGIKVGSVAIEAALQDISGVRDVAAVSQRHESRDELVVFIEPEVLGLVHASWFNEVAEAIRTGVNPLFKLRRVVVVDEIPRTASQKKLRRELTSQLDADNAASRLAWRWVIDPGGVRSAAVGAGDEHPCER